MAAPQRGRTSTPRDTWLPEGLLQVLARPLVIRGRVAGVQVPGDVGIGDGAERGWVVGRGCGGDPVGLGGGDLGEQPDGEPGVAGGVAGWGVGQNGSGLALGGGGEGEPGLGCQRGEDRGELARGVAGKVDDGREAGGQCRGWLAAGRGAARPGRPG